ncbi:MAG: hypothetical protein KDC05_08675 [Bacteroidales bacterium]|nr:hypothetical protein [Bacteroidales bacterium]
MGIFKKANLKNKGLKVINKHSGKKKVYEAYLKINPSIADKYLEFVAKNLDAVYITWDDKKQRFTT